MGMSNDELTVERVARLAGVTVRTLHHYDAIGLLKPSERTDANYRIYSRADLERLQQIRAHRALGLELEAIRRILDDPEFDRLEALRETRDRLAERIAVDSALLATLDRTLASIDTGDDMPAQDLFDGFDPEEHEAEVSERWGDTRAYAQSKRRTSTYGEAEWTAIRDEATQISADLATLLAQGAPAEGAQAMDVAERHRQHISRWFYPCDKAMHAQLAQLYTDDPRFEATYEKVATGLAAYVRAAVEANAGRD